MLKNRVLWVYLRLMSLTASLLFARIVAKRRLCSAQSVVIPLNSLSQGARGGSVPSFTLESKDQYRVMFSISSVKGGGIRASCSSIPLHVYLPAPAILSVPYIIGRRHSSFGDIIPALDSVFISLGVEYKACWRSL